MAHNHTPPEPPWTLRERLSVAWDRGSVRWLVGILTAVVLAVGLLAVRSKPVESVTAPQIVRSGSPMASSGASGSSASAASVSNGASASSSVSGSPSVVIVHVTGPVRNPGVVTLPAGSRVTDAVNAAGGLTKGRVQINLARVLVDGEQIDVSSTAESADAPGPGAATGSANGATGGSIPPGSKVNINKATASQLEELPRVGPVLASKIIEFRTQHGGFRSVDQLREVSGIGDATFAQLAPHVQV